MLLPTKHLPEERSLLFVGAAILQLLREPTTVSALWQSYRDVMGRSLPPSTLGYDWFVFALDTLYTIGAVDLQDGRIVRQQR